ncbi:MAG: DNA polymerase beta superfamily protein [Planctomycetaceae bacterium]
MASVVQTLTQRGLLRPPPFLPTNMMYETLMGSVAYGVSGDTSDRDVYGFAIPPRDHLFPHLAGEIAGFGKPRPRFENFQVHHVRDPDALAGKGCEYDFSIYSIPRFFTLCLECNPNMIDSLFTPQDCVLHQTHVGSLVRERRHLFLHKGVWTRFKSYAYAQLHKMRTREPEGKRAALREQFGFDVKYAYHSVRLLYECELLLLHGDMDLRRDREHLKAIRRGEVSEEEILRWAADKERQLEALALQSKLPDQPKEPAVRRLLLECLEEHYGSLDNVVARPDVAAETLQQISDLVDRYRQLASLEAGPLVETTSGPADREMTSPAENRATSYGPDSLPTP